MCRSTRGVVAQEPHGQPLIGAQLRDHEQATDPSLDGKVGEAPLLRLGTL
jgi:hypothetical protein